MTLILGIPCILDENVVLAGDSRVTTLDYFKQDDEPKVEDHLDWDGSIAWCGEPSIARQILFTLEERLRTHFAFEVGCINEVDVRKVVGVLSDLCTAAFRRKFGANPDEWPAAAALGFIVAGFDRFDDGDALPAVYTLESITGFMIGRPRYAALGTGATHAIALFEEAGHTLSRMVGAAIIAAYALSVAGADPSVGGTPTIKGIARTPDLAFSSRDLTAEAMAQAEELTSQRRGVLRHFASMQMTEGLLEVKARHRRMFGDDVVPG